MTKPGYSALRKFRLSVPGTEYFLTANHAIRGTGLEASTLASAIKNQWRKIETEGLWLVRTAVVMPDHLHMLVRLEQGSTLAECMRLLKGRMSPILRECDLKWQDGFYEHRLRENEEHLAVFLYIYLNPYRAHLVSKDQVWPGHFCSEEDWAWFGEMTDSASPQPEWLK